MRLFRCLFLVATSLSVAAAQQNATFFEGARLITGNGSAPIENSAIIIERSRMLKVGRKGELQLPAGAIRITLTGKTVMPRS
jgi:imidazolonepropionase-like amidohydrolase